MPPRRGRAPRPAPPATGRITVIAGVNGAGKSSIVGASVRAMGGRYFNPDEVARALREKHPAMALKEANARAWELGRRGLERAIARREHFTFETTLGGQTIAGLLSDALDAGLEVVVSFVGLDSPERHIARVRSRVARGGHDIPEAKVRQRYTTSRQNLVALLPRLTEAAIYDNSVERDLARGEAPAPTLLLRTARGRIRFVAPKESIPAWAQPIVAAAILGAKDAPGEPSATKSRRHR